MWIKELEEREEIEGPDARLGEAVRRAYRDDALTAEQRGRHLARLRGSSAAAAEQGRRAWRAPGRARAGLGLAGAALAFALVAALLSVIFRAWQPVAPDQRAAGELETARARGWRYAGAEVPGGGQLAFTSRQDGPSRAALINVDGSGLRLLADGRGGDQRDPGWSPDGARLVFSGERADLTQVQVVEAAGGAARQLTTFSRSYGAVWSPDPSTSSGQASALAFVSERDGRVNIYVMQADGSGERSVTDGIAFASKSNPVWSPDGARLAFETAGDIYVVGRDGQGLTRLTEHPGDDHNPSWSPDGRRIAYSSTRAGSADIWVMRADGSEQRPLTRGPEAEIQPAWSPDGWAIAYLRQPLKNAPDHETQLWAMGADGAGRRRVADIGGYGMSAPAWSPDSRQLAVVALPRGTPLDGTPLTNGRLWAVNADGSNARLLHEQVGDLSPPAWRPLWWPAAGAAAGDGPRLSVEPAVLTCGSAVGLRGEGFAPHARVTFFGAPSADGGHKRLGSVVAGVDGAFSIPLDLGRFAGCGEGAPGGTYYLGVSTAWSGDSSDLPDLDASVVVTVAGR